MKTRFLFFLLITLQLNCFATMEEKVRVQTASGELFGSLLIPNEKDAMPVVLIIAGSGPTDRNGNNTKMTNNSLLYLAEGLADNGIASLRFDKRGVGESEKAKGNESETRFSDMIDDASKWIELLDGDQRFSKIYVAGHSEGSLIGMIISQADCVNGYISIAGSGEPIDLTLRDQLAVLPGFMKKKTYSIIDDLKSGQRVQKVPFYLKSLFKPELQPYVMSWMNYDPKEEITKLDKPILIVQGDNDVQVPVKNAKMLKSAYPKAEVKYIEGMNHILKIAPTSRTRNLRTYKDPDLSVAQNLVETISSFINA